MLIHGHWLNGIEHSPIPGGMRMEIRRCVVIHFTAGATGRSSIAYWRQLNNGICAHVVIERDGEIIQCRPFDRTCGHAGRSKWGDPNTGAKYFGLNSVSIGIELANAGNDRDALSWARRQPGFARMVARHRNGGPDQEWETYPEPQVRACTILCKALIARYSLDDITGHDCIAPERKADPGPAFPMVDVREACGFEGLPAVWW